jgi:hypothetical protein
VTGMASDARCRTFLYRVSPMRRTATGENTGRLRTSRVVAHLRRSRTCRRPTTIDAPRRRECQRRRTTALSTGVPELSHCGHATARLPGARNLRGAMCAGAVKGAARGCRSTASGKLRLTRTLGARAGRSAVRPRPESTTSSAIGTRGRSRSRGIGGQEPTRAPLRRPTHHRSSPAS